MKKIYLISSLLIALAFLGGWYAAGGFTAPTAQTASSPTTTATSSLLEVRFAAPPGFVTKITSIDRAKSELVVGVDSKALMIAYPSFGSMAKAISVDENTVIIAGKRIPDGNDKTIALSELKVGDAIFVWPRESLWEILKRESYTALKIKKFIDY